jgi:hypothetical protein
MARAPSLVHTLGDVAVGEVTTQLLNRTPKLL